MARKIETYTVTKKVVMHDEHRQTEMHISLPKLQWMDGYVPPAPPPTKGPPRKYDVSSRAPSDGATRRGARRKG